jgi:hypothetical protein
MLFVLGTPESGRFAKYRAVEAYEIRPGILMMPKYSADGQVCKISIQRDHYVNGVVDVDSTLSREVLTKIFEELVPADQRGPLTTPKEFAGLSLYGGNTVATGTYYKYVSIQIIGPTSPRNDVAALITWEGRTCQAGSPAVGVAQW